MSCDYCLHLSHTFLACRSRSRCTRVREAITHLGPTIGSAAGTSLLASVPTALFCDLIILNNFGTIMCLSIVSGVLFGGGARAHARHLPRYPAHSEPSFFELNGVL